MAATWAWGFRSNGDANEAMQAGARVFEGFETEEHGSGDAELSLWLRDTKGTPRYRHLVV